MSTTIQQRMQALAARVPTELEIDELATAAAAARQRMLTAPNTYNAAGALVPSPERAAAQAEMTALDSRLRDLRDTRRDSMRRITTMQGWLSAADSLTVLTGELDACEAALGTIESRRADLDRLRTKLAAQHAELLAEADRLGESEAAAAVAAALAGSAHKPTDAAGATEAKARSIARQLQQVDRQTTATEAELNAATARLNELKGQAATARLRQTEGALWLARQTFTPALQDWADAWRACYGTLPELPTAEELMTPEGA